MLVATISFAVTILAIILVAFNLVKSNFYKITIYVVGLLAVWATTLLGVGVAGSDISREVTMSLAAAKNGWDLSIYDACNTSFVVGWLVPFLSKILFIDVIWVYKIVLPMIFATTPVILYSVFKRQMDSKVAFYASLFFIIMPVFSLEIPTIGKSMVAEPLFALFIYVLCMNWDKWLKMGILWVLLILIIWAHYTIGILALCFLLGTIIILAVSKLFKNWKIWYQRTIPIWMLCIIFVSGLSLGIIYYGNVAKGQLLRTLGIVTGSYTNLTNTIVAGNFSTGNYGFVAHNPAKTDVEGNVAAGENVTKPISVQLPDLKDSYLNNQGYFIRAALGLDFFETTMWGKIFRIFQFTTQALIIIGCCYMLRRREGYYFTAEYLACLGTAAVLLLFCIFFPFFHSTINMTRYYHISLFFLAPTLVIGAEAISRWIWREPA